MVLIVNQNRQAQSIHMVLLTRGMHEPKNEAVLQHFSEGVITFTTRMEADQLFKSFLIKRLKDPSVPLRRIPYSISSRGFTIETATRIT